MVSRLMPITHRIVLMALMPSAPALAAALADRNEAIPLTVRRRDGRLEEMAIVPELAADGQMREFGIIPSQSLTLASIKDPTVLRERTGLLPGDTITAVDGQPINRLEQLRDYITSAAKTKKTVTVRTLGYEAGYQDYEIEITANKNFHLKQ